MPNVNTTGLPQKRPLAISHHALVACRGCATISGARTVLPIPRALEDKLRRFRLTLKGVGPSRGPNTAPAFLGSWHLPYAHELGSVTRLPAGTTTMPFTSATLIG